MEANQLNTFLKDVEAMSVNALTVSKQVLADGKEHVTLELASRKVIPDRMESPRRAHTFHDADGFAAYLVRNGSASGTVVLIDIDSRCARAVLNDHAAQGFEVIEFRPPYHPKFELFKGCLSGTMDVKGFAQGAMLCRDLIAGVDSSDESADAGRDLALLMKQITVSNKVTAEHGTGNSCVNGLMLETNIRAGKADERVSLPETILIRTPIYLNTEPKLFELQLTIVPKSAEAVMIVANAPELPVIEHEVFEAMLVDVKGIEGALVSYGVVGHTDWKYNR